MSDPDRFDRGEVKSAAIAIFPVTKRRLEEVRVSFNRRELTDILNLYGRMVARGEWRDYAIDFHQSTAVFSIFRRASERPLYRIVKDPSLTRRQGMYSILSATGLVLKRGHELARILKAIDKPLTVVQ